MYKSQALQHIYSRPVWLWVVLLCLCFNKSNAQPSKPEKYTADTIEIEKLFKIAETVERNNPDSAAVLFRETLQKCIDAGYDYRHAGCLMKLGEYYGNTGKWEIALKYMKHALPFCKPLIIISSCYDHMGWVYFNMGDYVAASESYYSSLEYMKKTNKIWPNEAGTYNFLGKLNFRLKQNEKAIFYYNQGEAIARQNHYQNYLAFILLNKGEYYTSLTMTDSAEKCFEEVIEISDKIKSWDLKAEGNKGIGSVFIASGAYNKAIPYLQSAINLSENRDENIAIDASYYLGDAWYHTGRYKEAEAILLSALKQATTDNHKDNIIKGYTTLSNVYKATGQYMKSLDYMDSISVLKDSLMSAEKTKAINLMDIKFQTAEKDKEIAQKRLMILKQARTLTHKNIWTLLIIGSLAMMLLISIAIYRNTHQKQRLQAQQILSLEQENKIAILKAAVQGEDNERTRIARELHDGIGGMLSAAMMRFSGMHHDHKAITQIPAYKEAMDILGEMGDEIRKTAHNLMPEVLLKQPLPEALRAYCGKVQEGGTLQIDFQSYGSFGSLTEDFKLNVYRIIQELLKNVLQHAQASQALVQLMLNDHMLTVTVEDNGTGFDTTATKTGIGLHNLQTRVQSLDGHFTLESQAGEGTTVFIEFEIPKNTNTSLS